MNELNKVAIGARIKYIRNANCLSQAKFGKRLLCSQDIVSLWERGLRIPTHAKILMICECYGISETWLLHGEGERHDSICKQLGIKNQDVARVVKKLDRLPLKKLVELETILDNIIKFSI